MDLDAYTEAHGAEWARLEALARKSRLTGAEADELVEGYQAAASQLSAIKTSAGSTAQGERLSLTLSRARRRFTGAEGDLGASVAGFVLRQLPAALYSLRWLTLAVAVATIAIALGVAWWANAEPGVFGQLVDPQALKQLVDHDFVDYYSANPAASFTGQVWTNNAWIAAQCIALGIIGVFVPYLVVSNAVNVGITGAAMFHFGRGDVFFAYILPHGLLELTSVFVAAAAGLRIFWAWVAPGPRTRAQSLAAAGRTLFAVVFALAASLFVSGVIEGFVTPSALPVWAKIAIGALALLAFLAYMLVVGRAAARSGETGDAGEFERGADAMIAG